MHASFTRTLGVVGLLAVSLTGCQSASLGKFSWNPKQWKWGKKSDTALAQNNSAGAAADSTANPWTPQLPSQTAAPGYGSNVANSGYGQTSNQYSTATYPAVPAGYSADASQGAWGQPGGTAQPSHDPNAYTAAPAPAQNGYYGDYGQAPPATQYAPSQPGYGAPLTAPAPMQQQANAWEPEAQYGPAPGAYPPQQYGAPTAQMADNSQMTGASHYDGTQAAPAYGTQPAYGAQPAYGTQPNYSTPTGYESTPQQGTQTYPQYQPSHTAPAGQQYRPGGTSDYVPTTGNAAPTTGYDPSASGYPQ